MAMVNHSLSAKGARLEVWEVCSQPGPLGQTMRIYSVLFRKGCVRVVHDLHLAYKHVCEVLRARGTAPLSDLFFAFLAYFWVTQEGDQEAATALDSLTLDWPFDFILIEEILHENRVTTARAPRRAAATQSQTAWAVALLLGMHG